MSLIKPYDKSFALSIIFMCILIFAGVLWLLSSSQNEGAFDLKRDGAQLFKSVIPSEKSQRWRMMCKNREYQKVKSEMHSDPGLQKIIRAISTQIDQPTIYGNTRIPSSNESGSGTGYVFQDYIWIIEKSAVHTCHRDNNGTFFNEGQKHPSYTMLVYLDQPGASKSGTDKCLGVIPRSHTSKHANAVNVIDAVKDMECSTGDVIVFNANAIHVGTITDRDDNLRVQMKISHSDDLEVLGYYQNFNKVLNKENQNSRLVRQIQRHISCAVPFVSDLTQSENIRTAHGTAGGANISDGQKWFSSFFYGRPDFYDLPNAW